MMLVIITKRYNSSVLKEKVYPTPFDKNGNPRYAIYLDDKRATTLIESGVAEEYVLEENLANDPNVANSILTSADISKPKNDDVHLKENNQKTEVKKDSKNKKKKN